MYFVIDLIKSRQVLKRITVFREGVSPLEFLLKTLKKYRPLWFLCEDEKLLKEVPDRFKISSSQLSDKTVLKIDACFPFVTDKTIENAIEASKEFNIAVSVRRYTHVPLHSFIPCEILDIQEFSKISDLIDFLQRLDLEKQVIPVIEFFKGERLLDKIVYRSTNGVDFQKSCADRYVIKICKPAENGVYDELVHFDLEGLWKFNFGDSNWYNLQNGCKLITGRQNYPELYHILPVITVGRFPFEDSLNNAGAVILSEKESLSIADKLGYLKFLTLCRTSGGRICQVA
jgi:hypothetical protein